MSETPSFIKPEPYVPCVDVWPHGPTQDQMAAYHVLMEHGEITILRVTANQTTKQTVIEYLSCAPIEWTREALRRSQPIKQLTMDEEIRNGDQ